MTDRTYRGRDKINLNEFIRDVEECHFRTPYDTGANPNAMFIWNLLRQYAGLEKMTQDDLVIKYYTLEQGMSPADARATHQAYEAFKEQSRGH